MSSGTVAVGAALVRALRPRSSRITRRHLPVVIGLALILALLLASFFAPLPYDPVTPDPEKVLLPPSGEHWFGTDVSGLDVFSRVIASAKRDLPLALGGSIFSLLVGVPLGLLASAKGRAGERLMRALDIFQSFPLLVLAIAVVSLTGNQIQNVIYAIAIINVPRFMRLVRGEALALRESRFIEAATAIGASRKRIMFRHMLPNVWGVIFVQFSLASAQAIVVIAALNFIGIGVSPPEPTWGSMIQSGARNITTGQWWSALFPGAAVFVVVAALNVIADTLDGILNPD